MATSNHMVPTPTTPGMGYEESLYRGIALAQLRILKQQMQLGGLFIGNRRVRLDNGVEIFCNVSGIHESVQVVIPDIVAGSTDIVDSVTHGFAVFPRTASYLYGVDFNNKNGDVYLELPTDNTVFPNVDKTNGAMLVYQQFDNWYSKIPKHNRYGILSWSIKADKTLTWNGWPSVTRGADRYTNIPGVTVLDHQPDLGRPYFTPLISAIFRNGNVLETPCRVRGAALSNYGIVFVGTHNYTEDEAVNPFGQDWLYDNPGSSITSQNKSGKIGGHYDELFIQAPSGMGYLVNGRISVSINGWVRIGYIGSDVNNLPVWFSLDGMAASSEEATFSWSYYGNAAVPMTKPDGTEVNVIAVVVSTIIKRAQQVNTYTVEPITNTEHSDIRTASIRSTTANSTWQALYMLTKHAQISTVRTDITSSDYSNEHKYDDFVVKMELRPGPVQPVIIVNLASQRPDGIPAFGYSLAASDNHDGSGGFKYGPYSWKTDIGELVYMPEDENHMQYFAFLDMSEACGWASVTVTDACGYSATTPEWSMRGNRSIWGTQPGAQKMPVTDLCGEPLGYRSWSEFSGPGYPYYIVESRWINTCPTNMVNCSPLSSRVSSIYPGTCNDGGPVMDYKVYECKWTWICSE